jgi:hypothetical protein
MSHGRPLLILVACCLAASCGGASDGSAGVGGIGASACVNDTDCQPGCESIAAALRVTEPEPAAFIASRCEQTGIIAGDQTWSGPACECSVDQSSFAGVAGGPGDCAIYGRALQCLYSTAEFGGCDPGAAEPCASVCADLHARQVADARTKHDAQVHGAVCDAPSACICVVKIEGSCHVWNDSRSYDCALSAPEIVQRWQGR